MRTDEYRTPLPLGYRFQPTDDELILDFLYPKIKGISSGGEVMECDIYGEEDSWTWLFPEKSSGDDEAFYFFTRLKKKSNERGKRTCRVTKNGTWKTQKDDAILIPGTKIHVGSKRSFKFVPRDKSQSRFATQGWIMHEFRVDGQLLRKIEGFENDYVICKIKAERRKKMREDHQDHDLATMSNAENMMMELEGIDQVQEPVDELYDILFE